MPRQPGRGNRPSRRRAPAVSGAEPFQPRLTKTEAREAVEANVGERVRLADYRPTVTPLEPDERAVLVDQAAVMLEQVFVHLPLKRAMHVTDPVQRLRLLKLRHGALDERAFQAELVDIFTHLRDLHTNYVLPLGYRAKFAFLPFRIEEFYEGEVRRYVVSWVSPVSRDRALKAGAVVTHWNGSPIDLAVARHADREAGSNPDARRARGVEALTLRWLGMSLPPDEDWVVLTYTDEAGATRESTVHWEVVDRQDLAALLSGAAAARGEAGAGWGIDLKTALLHEVRKALFDPQAVLVEEEVAGRTAAAAAVAGGIAVAAAPPRPETSAFPDVFPRFGPVVTPSGRFGYIRLRTFAPAAAAQPGADVDRILRDVVREFARLLTLMPPAGLILDVRGNGGGFIAFGERILQMLTPRPITPEPFHFLSTGLTHEMTGANPWLGAWRDSIRQAIETGASFSQGFPLTAPEACNDVGQVYQGPVVLVTDALCYSTTDIFAAGFQDHAVGTILGVHGNTGAGGANVVDHTWLQGLIFAAANPFQPLPQGAGMRTAIRRSTRVGQRSGVPLEDLGVAPDAPYRMTRDDVLNNNVGLIAAAAEILSRMERQTLRLTAVGDAPVARLRAESENIDRIDLLVAGRPIHSWDVAEAVEEKGLPAPVPAGTLLVAHGYRAGQLVVTARLRV